MKTISGTTPLGAATEKRGYDTQGRVAAQSRTLTGLGETINTYNFYDGANLVEQWVSDSGNGGLPSAGVNQFVYEGVDQPIYASLGSSSVVYELDLAGNVRRIRLAADGTDLGGYRYTAVGQVYPADGATPAPTTSTGTAFTATTQPLQWKGRPAVDFGGGFYDMRARWWSPQVGAFTSVDELVYQDSRSTLWGWPGQNPLKWSDPSGHNPVGAVLGGLAGGIIGTISYAIHAPPNATLGDFFGAFGKGAVAGAIAGASPGLGLLIAGSQVGDDKDLGQIGLATIACRFAPGVTGASEPPPGVFRGPASGAKVVSPPGPGQVLLGGNDNPMGSMVLEGHGTTAPGSFIVPEGTYLQIPTDEFLSEAAGQQAAITGTLPDNILIPPGGRAPNLVLHPPGTDVSARLGSTTVTRPTLLQDILEPNMGVCVWGACRK